MTDPAAHDETEPTEPEHVDTPRPEPDNTEPDNTEPESIAPESIDDGEIEPQRLESTGRPEVDEVVASLGSLDERPVGEHVEVFERAHEALRGTLAGAGREAAAESGTERS